MLMEVPYSVKLWQWKRLMKFDEWIMSKSLTSKNFDELSWVLFMPLKRNYCGIITWSQGLRNVFIFLYHILLMKCYFCARFSFVQQFLSKRSFHWYIGSNTNIPILVHVYILHSNNNVMMLHIMLYWLVICYSIATVYTVKLVVTTCWQFGGLSDYQQVLTSLWLSSFVTPPNSNYANNGLY